MHEEKLESKTFSERPKPEHPLTHPPPHREHTMQRTESGQVDPMDGLTQRCFVWIRVYLFIYNMISWSPNCPGASSIAEDDLEPPVLLPLPSKRGVAAMSCHTWWGEQSSLNLNKLNKVVNISF